MSLSGEEIANIRKATGLTQEEFSRVYKIPYGVLASWEQGHRSPPETCVVYLRLIQSDPDGVAARIRQLDRPKPRRRLQEVAA